MKKIIEIEIGTPVLEILNKLMEIGVIKSWERIDGNNRKFLIEFN